jgi:hypothetical protein
MGASVKGAGGFSASLSSSHSQAAAPAKSASSGHLGLAAATKFAGGNHADHTTAAHAHAGNLTLHFHDGSTITVVGVTHIDASFLH